MSEPLLAIGTEPAAGLMARLGVAVWDVPAPSFDTEWSAGPTIEDWRGTTAAGPAADGVVVAVWPQSPRPLAVADQDLDRWLSRFEVPFAQWFSALAAGAERCAPDGQLVAVVDRTDPKDAAGWGAETALAEAVATMVHSFALIHQHRGARMNLVTWSGRLTDSPGTTLDEALDEVAATVAMLLSTRGRGPNSTVIHLGGGR